MKKLISIAALLGITVFSTSVFANKIIIKGSPLVLQKQGELYVIPDTYKVQEYQYVEIDGTKRACFLDKRPDFLNTNVVSINVQMGVEKATWNCYSLSPDYFIIQQ